MILVLLDRTSEGGEALQARLNELAFEEVVGTVNWTGAPVDLPSLNQRARTNKLSQLVRLDLKGVRVPPYDLRGYDDSWYPRTLYHQQGRDFTEAIHPSFYVKRLELSEEWRLHFFRTSKGNIKLLRSGVKVPRVPNPHPWVRSHRLGWKISYVGGADAQMIAEGKKAMEALGLDFGCVDIGLPAPYATNPVVLEVNTCPGIEGGTLDLYANEIIRRFGG